MADFSGDFGTFAYNLYKNFTGDFSCVQGIIHSLVVNYTEQQICIDVSIGGIVGTVSDIYSPVKRYLVVVTGENFINIMTTSVNGKVGDKLKSVIIAYIENNPPWKEV